MKPHEPHEAAVRRAKKLRQEYLARNYFSRDPDDGLLALRPAKPAVHGPLQKLTAQEKSRQTRLHVMKEKRERERLKLEMEYRRRRGQVRSAACGFLPGELVALSHSAEEHIYIYIERERERERREREREREREEESAMRCRQDQM